MPDINVKNEMNSEQETSNLARKRWMSVLARASLQAIAERAPPLPAHAVLRGPEAGLVMVRGRTGGGGSAFNLGEMTVTRCTIRDDEDRIGHAYIAGRDGEKAVLAARLDAALQGPAHDAIEQAVITPLAADQTAARVENAERAAATRVDFFTLATMRTTS